MSDLPTALFGLLGLLALHILCTGVQYSVLPIRLWNLKLGSIKLTNLLFSTMSAAVRLVYVHFPLATYVKEILSRSTNTDTGEMIAPA